MTNAYNTLVKKNNEEDHFGGNVIDERTVSKQILKNQGKYVNWIQVVQDRIQQWAAVNIVTSLQVPQKTGNFLVS